MTVIPSAREVARLLSIGQERAGRLIVLLSLEQAAGNRLSVDE
jgi:hypothetical protein